ncbi:MAG: CPBP family intramembrane glutamic endopeptidase [Eubacteriales bacterium]
MLSHNENGADENVSGRKDRRVACFICLAVVLLCGIMALADGVLGLPYIPKSALKLVLFLAFPLICGRFSKELSPVEFLRLPPKGDKRQRAVIIWSAAAGAILYVAILGGYFLLRGVVDFSGITASLAEGEGITRDTFPIAAAYITLCNSFVEELFFRGFAFLALERTAGHRFAYVFSAAAFSVYHAAILDGWFSPLIFILMLAGLFVGGLIFDLLAYKSRTVYPSWFLHMAANLGINTIGLILFGIIGG